MSTIYSITRDELLTEAISKLGVLAKGQTPDSDELTKAATSLKTLIGFLRTKGLFLWKRVETTITPTALTKTYNIGVGQTVNQPYPLKMLDAFSTYASGNQNVPIDIISEMEYNRLPTGSSSGMPLKLNYQPKLDYGVIRIWPTPDSSVASNYTFTIVYQAPFDFPENGTSTLDFPEEWYLPIVYQLAVLLAPDWGIPLEDRKMLNAEAKAYMEAVDGFGTEDASLYFSPRTN
jgi:hypothetical protein